MKKVSEISEVVAKTNNLISMFDDENTEERECLGGYIANAIELKGLKFEEILPQLNLT